MNSEEFRRVGFCLLFFACLIVLTLLTTFAAYLCTILPIASTATPSEPVGDTAVTDSNQSDSVPITIVEPEPCLDLTATLHSYPSLQFSKAKLCNGSSSCSSCCSICLMDYKESDLLRMLPGCSHFFHVNCVDPWLRMKLTCPICRKTPVTPQSLCCVCFE